MLLKEALTTHNNSKWKIDILELLGIEIKNDYCRGCLKTPFFMDYLFIIYSKDYTSEFSRII